MSIPGCAEPGLHVTAITHGFEAAMELRFGPNVV